MNVFEKAKWIWYSNIDTPDDYCEFYFKLPAKDSAYINLSCDGNYTLFVNGEYMASNQYGDFEHYKVYDKIDLGAHLTEKENIIGVLVHHTGKGFSRYKPYKPGLIFEVISNDTCILSSGKDIMCRQSKAYKSGFCRFISSQLGYGYSYDSTKEDEWIFGKGEGFFNATIIDKEATFFARPIQKQQLGARFEGKPHTNGEGYQIYDLGKEVVGHLFFEIEAEKETNINIAYHEYLLENGRVKRKIWDRDFSIDYKAKKGKNIFSHHMLRFACRYLDISFDAPIKINKIGIQREYYPTKRSDFLPSGELDAKIYEMCQNTLELCMMEHYVDCPHREQCLYAFDSRNQMLCGYYAFEGGNFEYARSNLKLMSMDRRDDGLLSICYPCGVDLTIPSFSLYYIISLYEYLKYTGDKSIIFEANDKINEIIGTFINNSENGLVKRFGKECHWNFYDWTPYLSGSLYKAEEAKSDPNINLLFIIALKCYKEICKIVGFDFAYEDKIKETSKNVVLKFYDEKEGIFLFDGDGKLELTNALGVLSGVLDDTQKSIIAKKIVDGKLISSSLSMKCFAYDALLSVDKGYKDYIFGEIRENYAHMIETGTAWETVIGTEDFDGSGSLCHGWSAVPIYYYNILK